MTGGWLVGLAAAAALASGTTAIVAQDPAPAALAPGAVDLASVEMGGRAEWATSLGQSDTGPENLIATTRNHGWMSGTTTFPQDIVFSFFSRQPALVSRVEINPASEAGLGLGVAKDIEVWLSSEGPKEGFTKIAEASLKNENALQVVDVPPTEATFVKVRVLSTHAPPGTQRALLRRVRVIEGARPGYVPMVERHPALAALARGEIRIAPAEAGGPPPPPGGRETCRPSPRASGARFPQSRNVLLVEGTYGVHRAHVRDGNSSALDQAVTPGVTLRMIIPDALAPAILVAEPTIDTIILGQVCDTRRLSKVFTQALMAWVAAGHKLIIQDSDACKTPDYDFLPYPFKTVNPGSSGARGVAGILEDSTLVSGNPDDKSFLDMKRWNDGPNDLGDSNVVVKWDERWCGAMWARNVLRKSGFALAYAHFGRGLIIYDGVDYDQNGTAPYKQLVAQELLQPFDPDGLTCSNPLGGFTIATDNRLKSQHMTPGQTYTYPLEVLGNWGYSGKVALEASVVPADPGMSVAFTNAVADLSGGDEATSTLTVTSTASASIKSKVIAIRGKDASGTSNVLCLDLPERTTGGLSILSGLRRDKPPTKNLEIILDASGSMKAMLGKQTRWATAQAVLKEVVSKLPKDYSVGLRAYGHTLPSTNPGTCTDTALVVPVGPLNPTTLLAAASKLAPRGETPLVHSILQTPADLKTVGGGTVILITDGEESCKGDLAAAARTLKEAGLNLTLNIVGFTLKNVPAQAALSGLAESTGGRYYSAQSGAALSRALLLAAVDKLPYRILDAAGAEVGKGEAGTTRPHELPPGAYTVVVTAGEETLKAPVTVALRQDQTMTVVVKGDTLAVEK